MKSFAICCLLVPVASLAGRQTASQSEPVASFSMGFQGTVPAMRPIVGKPYSAKRVTEHTQTLADGTHIVQPSRTVLEYRDSAGRTRTDRPVGPVNTNSEYTIVEIRDPVSGYQYTVDPYNKVAHRVAMRASGGPIASAGGVIGAVISANAGGTVQTLPAIPPAQPPTPPLRAGVATANISDPNRPQIQREQLGTQVMEGLVVEGTRQTTTVPVGAQGNDRPMVTVREMWFSKDLSLFVLTKGSDPRNGETITKMTEISTREPDAALFQPPSDYAVVDETEPFQIQFSTPAKP